MAIRIRIDNHDS